MVTESHIAIINYTNALTSAVHGLSEMFILTNMISESIGSPYAFKHDIINTTKNEFSLSATEETAQTLYKAIILPPSLDMTFSEQENTALNTWLNSQHKQGAIICSVCSGVFILAKTGLLKNRTITTHWAFPEKFSMTFSKITLDTRKIIINDGDIITAGGLMAWVDLGLELIAQFSNANIMRILGKQLVVDTGLREQRYYQSFTPILNHSDEQILKIQHHIQKDSHQPLLISALANMCCISDRTFSRRFIKATAMSPSKYIQRIRIQKACYILETTNKSIDNISHAVGYEDISTFRRAFIKVLGLSPKDFKKRFVKST